MNQIDEVLRELAGEKCKDCGQRDVLAGALLRAREALERWDANTYVCQASTCKCESKIHFKDDASGAAVEGAAVLADTALQEALIPQPAIPSVDA